MNLPTNIRCGDCFWSAPRFGEVLHGEQLLSADIIHITQRDQNPTPSHGFQALSPTVGFEMTAPSAQKFDLIARLANGQMYWQGRWTAPFNDGQYADFVARASMWEGKGYGYLGLEWDGFDRLFDTRAVSQLHAFTGILVCTGLQARLAKDAFGQGFRDAWKPGNPLLGPSSVTPADGVANMHVWPMVIKPLWDNVTDQDRAKAAATWAMRLQKIQEMAAIATAGWPPPGA